LTVVKKSPLQNGCCFADSLRSTALIVVITVDQSGEIFAFWFRPLDPRYQNRELFSIVRVKAVFLQIQHGRTSSCKDSQPALIRATEKQHSQAHNAERQELQQKTICIS